MDYDQAWCPACDRQIEPKRTTITVPLQRSSPAPPPPPPSSPRKTTKATVRKGGLVHGTGRVRHNGTIKPPPVPTKQRTIIDQGPTALYCSDECQFADINARRGAPIDPAREEPTPSVNQVKPNKSTSTTSTCETESDTSSSSSVYSAPIASPSLAKMAELYNWGPLPPPPPVFEDDYEYEYDPAPLQYNSGIMMAGRLLKSLIPSPTKPHVGPHRPTPEPRKVVAGWTDGSDAWRSAIYTFAPPTPGNKDPFNRRASPPSSASVPRRKSSTYSALALNSAPAAAFHSASDEMLNKFSANLSRRCESRTSLYAASYTAKPTSPVSTHSLPLPSPKRERNILPRAAEGKLLVPDVKLKVHGGSSVSLSSAWSGPTSSSSRQSVCSPLSVTSDSDEDAEVSPSPVTKNIKVKRRPAQNTRSWSYDNVMTYDIMPVPPKKVKKMEKQIQIIDGEEVEVEVEVEAYEPLKRLFNFAPSISSMSPR